jgi:hypothetical protein
MSIEEAVFVVLVIVGVTATILAASALIADFFFGERPARPAQRAQATYRKGRPE